MTQKFAVKKLICCAIWKTTVLSRKSHRMSRVCNISSLLRLFIEKHIFNLFYIHYHYAGVIYVNVLCSFRMAIFQIINKEGNTLSPPCTRPRPRTVYKASCVSNIKIICLSDFSFLTYRSIWWCDLHNELHFWHHNMFILDSTKNCFHLRI